MSEKDLSPIDQRWIQQYVDQLLEGAKGFPEGTFRDALLRRAEHAMDLTEAWQTRNHPRSQVTHER